MKRKFFVTFLCLCYAFVSCNDSNDDEAIRSTITFEQAALNNNHYQNQTVYSEAQATFSNAYDETSNYWCGFAISSCTDTQIATYNNQYSVYGNGGANSSTQFAVGYCGDYLDRNPVIEFLDIQTVESIYVNNSTYTYLSVLNGSDYNRAFTSGDYLLLTITGFNEQNVSCGSVDFYLADYRQGKTSITDSWEKVSLEKLGLVKKLVFTMTTTDIGAYGANTPLYFCLDDITYK